MLFMNPKFRSNGECLYKSFSIILDFNTKSLISIKNFLIILNIMCELNRRQKNRIQENDQKFRGFDIQYSDRQSYTRDLDVVVVVDL